MQWQVSDYREHLDKYGFGRVEILYDGNGAQCVMIIGELMMLVWFVDNLAFLVLLLLYKGSSVQDGTGDIWLDNVAYTVNERSQWNTVVQSRRGDHIIVDTVKMQVLDVVSINIEVMDKCMDKLKLETKDIL